MSDDPRMWDDKTDRALTRLEAEADKWAVECDLPSMIKNIVSPMRLNWNAPQKVRERYIGRMESLIDVIIRQAFIEGAYRNHCGTADIQLPCDVRVGRSLLVHRGEKLGKAIREVARVALAEGDHTDN